MSDNDETKKKTVAEGGVTVQGPSDDAAATQGFGGGDPTAGSAGAAAAGAGDTTVGDGTTVVDGDEADVPTGHQAPHDAAADVDRGAQGRIPQ
jgi:hypothetical protein